MKIDLDEELSRLSQTVQRGELKWKKTKGEGLDLDYMLILRKDLADELYRILEESIEYNSDDLSKVKVFGKWHKIPRQQAAYGDEGMNYSFSGTNVPAKPWNSVLNLVKDFLANVTGVHYNFVLVNRYRDGNDHIGAHRDNEPDLDPNAPIASLSLGQSRFFVLQHADTRKKGQLKRKILPIKIELQHGSLLLMNPPTNKFWYHSLPPKKSLPGVRINLTFRKLFRRNYE